jgi:hypothetical protein
MPNAECRMPSLVATRSRPLPVIVRRQLSRAVVIPHLPTSLPPPPPTTADAPSRSSPSATALAVPPPRELSLSRRSPFGIAVVGTAAAADAYDDGDRIPSSAAATIIVATKPSSPPPPPISSSSLSCLRQSAVTATVSCLADTLVISRK